MHKCDFCRKDSVCYGVRRSECLLRDNLFFEVEQTPADDATAIARLLTAYRGTFAPQQVATYLVDHGVGVKG